MRLCKGTALRDGPLPDHRLDGVAQDLGVGHAVGAELLEPVHPEAVELGTIPDQLPAIGLAFVKSEGTQQQNTAQK